MSSNSKTNASALNANERKRVLNILESNWQAEMRGCHTYELWAERETEPQRRIAFRTLAKAEKHHADLWAERIRVLGGSEPTDHGPRAGEANTIANRIGGLGLALRRLELDESHDIAKYAKQLEELGDEPSIVILKQVIEDEREHYRTLNNLIRNRRPIPQSSPQEARKALDELLVVRQKGQGQAQAAGWIGDAIYGVNDGLGAIFGIVSGVSGATLGNSKFVVIAGMVGMIASALSMGSGAYLAAKSEREICSQADFFNRLTSFGTSCRSIFRAVLVCCVLDLCTSGFPPSQPFCDSRCRVRPDSAARSHPPKTSCKVARSFRHKLLIKLHHGSPK